MVIAFVKINDLKDALKSIWLFLKSRKDSHIIVSYKEKTKQNNLPPNKKTFPDGKLFEYREHDVTLFLGTVFRNWLTFMGHRLCVRYYGMGFTNMT